MHGDEEIDFEELIKEEAERQREQEKHDAELARKMMEDELQRQEQEQLMLAIKYSQIDEKNRKKAQATSARQPAPQLTTYQPYNEAKFKEQLGKPGAGGGGNGGGKRKRGKGRAQGGPDNASTANQKKPAER